MSILSDNNLLIVDIFKSLHFCQTNTNFFTGTTLLCYVDGVKGKNVLRALKILGFVETNFAVADLKKNVLHTKLISAVHFVLLLT